MKTNFQKVLDFNKSFGVTTRNSPQYDLFKADPKLVEYRLSLIREEVKELEDAVVDHDLKETIDALTDILYVVYGAYTAFGIDADKAFDIVQNSNMSKLCKSEEEAIRTVESYKADSRYDSPTYRLSDDGSNYVVYNKSTSKILKSIEYTPADFSSLF